MTKTSVNYPQWVIDLCVNYSEKLVRSLQWGWSHSAREYYHQGWIALACLQTGIKSIQTLSRLEQLDRDYAYARQLYGGPTWSQDTQAAVSACWVLAAVVAELPPSLYHVRVVLTHSGDRAALDALDAAEQQAK